MKSESEATVGKYITHKTPFGPIDASLIKTEHNLVLKDLFDPQNKIFDALQDNPSMIIGRRGSGKTAHLHSVFLGQEFTIVKEIKTSATFARIVDAIEKSISTPYLSESVSELWEQLFYFALFSEVAKKHHGKSRELRLLNDYLAKEDLDGATAIDTFLWKTIKTLSEKSGENLTSAVSQVVLQVTGIKFAQAKSLVVRILREEKERAIILLDSLEQYPVTMESVAHALSGLLKCVGQFNERNERLSVRLCLPAELYHVFVSISSAPLKDFSNALTLHWVAGELVSIAARRLGLYLKMYFPEEFRRMHKKFDLDDRAGAQSFLKSYLPDQIQNRCGHIEDGIAYILRHTQLQPRHFLMYLNAIFEEGSKSNRKEYPRITEGAVIKSIAKVEHRLCEEVFSGYSTRYPMTKDVCEMCIPNLKVRFSHSDAQKVFNRHGKKVAETKEYWTFMRLLIETGIVGRLIGETERYNIAQFEYTEPHKLVVGANDALCLHPVFAKVFNCINGGTPRTTYPFGCNPDADDYRQW